MNPSNQFSSFYDRFVSKIYSYHYYRTSDKATAEDLTSQTFLKAWESFSKFKGEEAQFSAWIYRIAHNALIDHHRKHRPTEVMEEEGEYADDRDFIQDLKSEEDRQAVLRALQFLTEHQKEIVLMRVWDELPFATIAKLLGKSEGAVKIAFYRSLQDLQSKLMISILLFLQINLIINPIL